MKRSKKTETLTQYGAPVCNTTIIFESTRFIIMTEYITGTDHYNKVLARVVKVRKSLRVLEISRPAS